MKLFKDINYGLMLFDALRNYFSVNSSGNLSILYRYLLSCLYPLQDQFDNFGLWRVEKKLIAGCAYQIGQFTNLLNYLYDSALNRIYIDQASNYILYAPTFDDGLLEADMTFAPTFDGGIVNADMTYATTFDDFFFFFTIVTIWIPATYYADAQILSQITATVEQIKIDGLDYQIKQIP